MQIRAGMSIGRTPGEPQWAPDMRKNEDDITDYEKREAKRRIQGSLSEESPEDSCSDEQLALPPQAAA